MKVIIPGDRGFKSRSPDQNRQFSERTLAVLTFMFLSVYSISIDFKMALQSVQEKAIDIVPA